MMERFPTWHVWRLLHAYPMREIPFLLRLLRIKAHSSEWMGSMNDARTWVVLSVVAGIVSSFLLPMSRLTFEANFWILSVMVSAWGTFDSLRFALNVVSDISKWRGRGNYDLFAVLPTGELMSLLNLCRVHRAYLKGHVSGIEVLVGAIVLLTGVLASANNSPEPSYENGFIYIFAILVLIMLLISFHRCIDYFQSFVSATLIALLANQHRNQSEARWAVVGGFLGIQLLIYGAIFPFIINLPFFLESPQFRFDVLHILWVMVAVPLIVILIRELVNFGLWQAVKRRLEAE